MQAGEVSNMPLIQEEKFKRKNEKIKRLMVSVPIDSWFTLGELKKAKELLEQPQSATCIKQLARIGLIVIQEHKISEILAAVSGNRRRNKIKGIVEYGQN